MIIEDLRALTRVILECRMREKLSVTFRPRSRPRPTPRGRSSKGKGKELGRETAREGGREHRARSCTPKFPLPLPLLTLATQDILVLESNVP